MAGANSYINFVVANVRGSYCPIVLCLVRIPCSESSPVVLEVVDFVGTANSAVLRGGWETRFSEAYPILIVTLRQRNSNYGSGLHEFRCGRR